MNKRTPLAMFAAGLLLSTTTPAPGQEVVQSAYHDYRLVPVVEDLVRPWSIAFLPDGEMLVTEKAGTLRVVRDGMLLPEPVKGVPEVISAGQGGLLDVVPHPSFEDNRLLYLSFSKPNETERGTTAVIRGRYENGALTNIEEIFLAVSEGRGHYGSRLVFDGQGHLFITVGERQASTGGDLYAHPAQDPSNHHGTVNRVYEDGGIPEDNPFVGDPSIRPEIWSYGHRNQQGMVINPETGDIWATEHGPQGGDELNLVQPGLNYGWPVVGYGVNYGSGTAIHEGTHKEGMEPPGPLLGAVDRGFRTAPLHGRPLPELEGEPVRGRDGRRAVGPPHARRAAGRARGDARPGSRTHPRCPAGSGRADLHRHRRPAGRSDRDPAHGAGRDALGVGLLPGTR